MVKPYSIVGKLRHKITVQKVTETSDAHGGIVEAWADYVTDWASVEPLMGREFFSARQDVNQTDYKIRLRYSNLTKDITPKMRAVWGAEYLIYRPPLMSAREIMKYY